MQAAFVISQFLIIPLSHSADRNAQQAFQQVVDSCLSPQSLNHLHCEVRAVSSLPESVRENYDRNSLEEDWIDPIFADRGSGHRDSHDRSIMDALGELNRQGVPGGSCPVEASNEQEFDVFLRRLTHRIRSLEHQVPIEARPYFRAYAAKCATSTLIGYSERENQGFRDFMQSRYFSSVADIWARGQGECTEIARLATELGRTFGAPLRNVSTFFHEFNETVVGNRPLYFDASSPTCTFFSRD